MNKLNRLLLFCFIVFLPKSVAIPQQGPGEGGGPAGWHDEGSGTVSYFDDVLLEADGTITALGVAEEDYSGFGHFLDVDTTLSGGGNNRTITQTAGGKFFVVAEASFLANSGDAGAYTVTTDVEWHCPYYNLGFSDGPGSMNFGVSISNHDSAYKDLSTSTSAKCVYDSFNCVPGTVAVCGGVPHTYINIHGLACQAGHFVRSFKVRSVLFGIVHEVCVPAAAIQLPASVPLTCS